MKGKKPIAKSRKVSKHVNRFAKAVYDNAIAKGFWDGDPGPEFQIPRKLALIHSEVSEALEEHRKGESGWEARFGEELADVVIRAFDLAEGYDLNIGDIIVAKHLKNLNRPHGHGRKY